MKKTFHRAHDAFVELGQPPIFEMFDVIGELQKKRQRRLSLSRAIRQARKEGVDLIVSRDGSMTLRCSEPVEPVADPDANMWDTAAAELRNKRVQ